MPSSPHHAQFALLRHRRFLPLFVTQFLGALNDNLFKNALVVLVNYRLAAEAGLNGQILVTMAAGIFILPFFIFSATAGRLAEKYDKKRLILAVKTAEILFMAIAATGLAGGHVSLLFLVLFLMGVHSTFFGPLKYGILPAHLARDELLAGNGLVEAGTYIAILLGTIAGIAVIVDGGVAIVSGALLVIAACGLISALFIPRAPAEAPELRVHWNVIADTRETMRYASERRDLFLAILGISWFWLVGATFLSQFPNLAKEVVGGDATVQTFFLIAFTLGIAVGSLLCNRLLKGEVSPRLVPIGALGISLFAIDLYLATGALPALEGGSGAGSSLIGVGAFLTTLLAWRILADLVLIAISGGIFIVPLYTMLQARAAPGHRSRIIAANNIWNALFMVLAAVATSLLLALHVTVPEVFLIVAILNLFVTIWIAQLLPGRIGRRLETAFLRLGSLRRRTPRPDKAEESRS